jgi:hypothetical protein
MKKKNTPLEKIEGIQELIGFVVYNEIVSKSRKFYYDRWNLPTPSQDQESEYWEYRNKEIFSS